jgi:hypothetical protein
MHLAVAFDGEFPARKSESCPSAFLSITAIPLTPILERSGRQLASSKAAIRSGRSFPSGVFLMQEI